jgi:hypothetical protein
MMSPKAAKKRRNTVAVWSAVVAACVTLGISSFVVEPETPTRTATRFTVETPENGSMSLFGRPSVSPDGQSVLFAVSLEDSRRTVWYLHSFSTKNSVMLPQSENISAVFWSADSRAVLLYRTGSLWKMDLQSSTPQRLPVAGAYSSWQPEGIVSGGQRGIRRFDADGSHERWIKRRDDEHGVVYSYPTLIPGGRWLIYNAESSRDDTKLVSVRISSLDGTVDREIRLAERPSVYAAPGYLLSIRGDTLTAQAIDPQDGTVRGELQPIAGPVGSSDLGSDRLGAFSASNNGVLVFRNAAVPGGPQAANSFTVIQNWPSLLRN